MTAPARHNHVFHGLKKPEIAYLPTAYAGALPFPPRTVLSCYSPYMGWQSWRFEGQTFESPHILVYDWSQGNAWPTSCLRSRVSLARDFACLTIFVMAGLDPAIHVFAGAIPGSRSASASLV